MSALAPMNAQPPKPRQGAWGDVPKMQAPAAPSFEGPYIGDVFAAADGGKGKSVGKGWEDPDPGKGYDSWAPGGRGKGKRGPPPPPPVPEFDMVPILGGPWGGKPPQFAIPGFKGGWEAPMFDMKGDTKGDMKGDMKGSKGKGAGKKGAWDEGKGEAKGKNTVAADSTRKGKGSAAPVQEPRRHEKKPKAEAPVDEKDGPKDEVMAEIETMLAEAHKLSNGKCSLEKGDFDFRVRRYLLAIRSQGGRSKVKDALAMLQTYTLQKSRESVQVWPAYILTLLKKFEPDPFTKGGGKGKAEDDRKKEKVSPAPKPQAQPVVPASAPIVASAQTASTTGTLQVVPVLDFLQEELPPGWDEGHGEALQRLNEALPGSGQGKCPFTRAHLDLGAAFVTQATSSLAQGVSKAPGPCAHLLGLAKSLELAEHCPRSAEAASASGQGALTGLESDATAADAAEAATGLGSGAAASVMRELGLELSLQVLRNPMIN